MNERIKELIKQSYVWVKFPEAFYRGDDEPHSFLDFDKEKFAELIVQRTLAIVEAHTEIFQSDEARAMVEHIKHSVKTDMGVES